MAGPPPGAHSEIKDECGVEIHEDRYVIVGCEDVPGFEAVALGQKVDVEKVTPGRGSKHILGIEQTFLDFSGCSYTFVGILATRDPGHLQVPG